LVSDKNYIDVRDRNNQSESWGCAETLGAKLAEKLLNHRAFLPDRSRAYNCPYTQQQQAVRFGTKADIGRTLDEHGGARQDNPDLIELARLCIDFDCAARIRLSHAPKS